MRKQKLWNKLFGSVDCNTMYCYAEDQLEELETIPESVDFRELGLISKARNQGGCGSCWAFATIAGLETCLLRDKKYVKEQWQFQQGNISLSEQFLMMHSRGFNSYCAGGDSTVALWQMKTIELNSNFPYQPTQQNNHEAKQIVNESYLPYKLFPMEQDKTQMTGAVKLFLEDSKSFGKKDIRKVKEYLARGYPVYASMLTNTEFISYNGKTVFSSPCQKFDANHQVIFTGYGKKNGKDVWIIKNSWGEQWGSQGFFYAEIGKDALCLEHYAFGVIPQFADDQIYQKDENDEIVFNSQRGQGIWLD